MTGTADTEAREITIMELTQAFEGKFVNVLPADHYGISIEMNRGTLEYEDDLKPELWLVMRDGENNVTGSLCVDGESVESIEAYDDGTYTVSFNFDMPDISISEYKLPEQLQREHDERHNKE